MKRFLRIVLVAAAVLLVAGFAAKRYLSSSHVAGQVGARLQQLYGGATDLAGVDIGFTSSSISGLELKEAAAEETAPVWLTVDHLDTNLNVFDLVGGDVAPSHLHLIGARLLLRFDRDGRLLTRLPSSLSAASDKEVNATSLPEIRLQRSQVTLRKEGAADLVMSDVNAKLNQINGQVELAGDMASAGWGRWTIQGKLEDARLQVDLQSDGAVAVDQGMLEQIPFVPASVWREVKITQGKTPCQATVRYDLKSRKLNYRVELAPAHVTLHVPVIELAAANVTGHVVVADGLVQLRGLAGDAFSGTIRTDADLDFRSAAAHLKFAKLEVKETVAQEPAPVWLTVDHLDTNLNVFDPIGGDAAPNFVELTGARVLLRFDREGRLLTRLSSTLFAASDKQGAATSLPEIRLQRSQVTLRKEGAADLVLTDINAKFHQKNGLVELAGDLDSAGWGRWTIQGKLDDARLQVDLQSDGAVAVDQGMLEQIPFVPASVWREVKITQGKTPCQATVRYDLKSRKLNYRVELAPVHVTLHVPVIELAAANVTGHVVVADGLVQLRGLTGDAFSGTIRTDADLDFRGAAAHLKFAKLEVDRLVMHQLPASWKLPRTIQGKLVGSATLEIIVPPGGADLHTTGSGKARIVDAMVGGQPAKIWLRLQAVPGGFRFGSEEAGAKEDSNDAQALAYAYFAVTALGLQQPLGEGHVSLAPLGDFMVGLVRQFYQGKIDLRRMITPFFPEALPPAPAGAVPSYLEVNLKMKDVDLAPFIKALGVELPFPVAAKLTFQAKANIPVDNPDDLRLYKVSGKVELTAARIDQLWVDELQADITFLKGILALNNVRGRLGGLEGSKDSGLVTGEARVQTSPLGMMNVDLNMDKISLREIVRLTGITTPVTGMVSGKVKASADLAQRPWQWNAAGEARGTGLKIADFAMESVKFRWVATPDLLKLQDVDIALFKGQATGHADIPLSATTAGLVRLQISKVDSTALSKTVPGMPVKVQGDLGGELKMELPAMKPGAARTASLKLDLKAPKLRVQNIPTEQLLGSVEYKDGLVDYRLEGKSLGGTFEVEGQVPVGAPVDQKIKPGSLRLDNMQMGRLLQALNMGENIRNLRGRLSIDVDFTHRTTSPYPVGSGRLRISQLRWKDTVLANVIVGDLVLAGDQLRLRELTTGFGQGIVRAQMSYNLRDPNRGWFSVNLDGVEAENLLAPWLDDLVQGPVQARMRGSLGVEWSGTLDVEMQRGKVGGLEVAQWRIPAMWRYAPSQGQGQLTITESSAQIAQGRVTAKLDLAFGASTRLDGQVLFSRVELQKVLQQTIGSSETGSGKLSGRIRFSGQEVRGLEDIQASLDASFDQAQAAAVPVVRQISPLIGIGQSTTFQKGDLQARLNRGVIRIQRLALEGGVIKVYLDGTLDLQGRLNLDVTASTGNFLLDAAPLRILRQRVPVVGALSGALLQEATRIFASRVLHAHVTGTVRSPITRIMPLPTLAEEAVRFFLFGVGSPLAFVP